MPEASRVFETPYKSRSRNFDGDAIQPGGVIDRLLAKRRRDQTAAHGPDGVGQSGC